MNPDERVPGLSGVIEDLAKLPKNIEVPSGVERNDKWYAQFYTTQDGRVFYEFYRRGKPLPASQAAQDPVYATVQGPTNTEQADRFKKDKEKADKPDPTVSAPPNQPNIVSRNQDGSLATAPNPNYTPSATQRPSNAVPNIEGTPLPGGGSDNSRPIKVWRTPDGQQAGAPDELTADERKRWEQEKNQAAGRGYKTDAEVANPKAADAADVVGKPTGNSRQRTEGNTTVKETEYVLPDGKKEWREQKETSETTAADLVGKPTGNTRQRDEDGQAVKETEYVLPDGKREWRQQTEAAKPGTRKEVPYTHPKTGKQYTKVTEEDPKTHTERTYYVDPATGKEVTLDESENIKGVPSFTPDLTKPGVGLIDRAKQLDELLAAGTITWEQRQRVLQADQLLASTVANEFNTGATILREDFQNQVSQRNVDVTNAQHRASLANTHAQNAFSLVQKFAPYLGAEKGRTAGFFTSLMAGQLALATSYGGMKDFPREQLPTALREFAERAVGTTPGAAGAAPSSPAPAPSTAPATPTAVAPAVPVSPAVAATETTDAGGVPREYTPASATNAPVSMGPRPSQAAERLFGQQMPRPRPPEADSWRQQALDRQSVALGQNVLGAPPAVLGVDDGGAAFNRPIAPILNTQIPGLTPELDQLARQQLDTDYFGIG